MTLQTPIDQPSRGPDGSQPVYEPPTVLATFAKRDLAEDLPENLSPHIHTVVNS